jgi:heme A synthase
MRKVFAGLAMLLMLAVVAQFFLAANGAFNTAPNDESFQPHRVLGFGIVQSLIRAIADAFGDKGDTTTTTGQLIFGLHGINALVIMAAVATIVRQARALSRSAAPTRHARPGDDAIASGQAAEPAS